MTNSVDKQQLVAALDCVREGIERMGPMNALLAGWGLPETQAYAKGAGDVVQALLDGINGGKFDACDEDDLDPCAVPSYPEDEGSAGVIMLPPCPSDEEREELIQWAANNGFIIIEKA